MKKLLPLLLCLLLLIGCGAEPTSIQSTSTATQATSTAAETSEARIEVRNNSRITLSNQDWVQSLAMRENLDYVQGKGDLPLKSAVLKDGEAVAMLRWDGNTYTISDANGERMYRYLSYLPISYPEEYDVDYAECFVLSNEPFEQWDDTLMRSAYTPDAFPNDKELVYADYMDFDRAETFCDVPEDYADERIQRMFTSGIDLGRDSLYHVENGTLRRYDYNFNLLSETDIDAFGITAFDLNDGGFLRAVDGTSRRLSDGTWAHDMAELFCYDAEGKLRWRHTFDYPNHCVEQALEYNGVIYTFGTVETPETDIEGVGSPSDVYVCKFSLDGELLQSECFGGRDFDWFSFAEVQDGKLYFYGKAQSRSGDLYPSPDGYGVGWCGTLSEDLTILDMQKSDRASSRFYGYLNETPIFAMDHADISPFDIPMHIPEYSNTALAYLLPTEDGYVVVSRHTFDRWKLNPGWRSHCPSYRELIFTGYSWTHEKLWQTVSPIYVG